nr:hypothetical protein [uncultured Methanoregula sp.]
MIPGKKQPGFSLSDKDGPMEELVRGTDKRTLAIWATDCVERILPYFEDNYPDDPRPRNALDTGRAWIQTGIFHMADIRKASLDAHAAARDVGKDNAARSAARAAGQAVATAHVPTHSLGAAKYARQAVWRNAGPPDADTAVAEERNWQYRHLVVLREKSITKK